MKKSHYFLIVASLLIVISCSKGAVEEAICNYVTENETFHVLAIPVGDNVNVPSEPLAEHIKKFPTCGSALQDNVWLTNHIFMNTPMYCLLCDSCMTVYEEAGLIDYKKSDNGTASISLTSKGKKYRIENYLPDFELERNRDDVELVVLAYSEADDIRYISEEESNSRQMDKEYICEANIKKIVTPFFECMGYDESKENPESMCIKTRWKVSMFKKEVYDKIKERNNNAVPYWVERLE